MIESPTYRQLALPQVVEYVYKFFPGKSRKIELQGDYEKFLCEV